MAGICGKDNSWFSKKYIPKNGLVYLLDPDNLDCYKGGNLANDIVGSGYSTNINSPAAFGPSTSGNIKIGSSFLLNGAKLTVNSDLALRKHIFPITLCVWVKNFSWRSQQLILFGGASYYGGRSKSLSIKDNYPISAGALQYCTTTDAGSQICIQRDDWYYVATPTNSYEKTSWNFYTVSISGTLSSPLAMIGINNNFMKFDSSSWGGNSIASDNPHSNYSMLINGSDVANWPLGEPAYIGMTFMYTKALTDVELSSIYQATRSRYGV